jgi:hypothetical protein
MFSRTASPPPGPTDPKRLVVGIVSPGTPSRCYVKTSADGGRTWGALVQLPQFARAECSSESWPAVTCAAGGGRLYAAYSYGVAVSVSTDQGATWSIPTSVFGDYYEEDIFFDVRLAAAPDGSRVYVAAEYYHYYGGGHELAVLFSSSDNQGSSWSPVKKIAASFPEDGTWLYGFALAAGRGGNVFVAYGWEDGWPLYDQSVYTVRVARSADHGASFIYGVADQNDDLDNRLRNPDIEIGPSGTAHLVYEEQHDPGTAILYKYSYAPYSRWSGEPVRLDDVPYVGLTTPRLAVGTCGKASVLHATWLESLDVSDFPSKVLYARKVARPGYAWSDPLKVGTLKNGIYTNGLAAAGPKAFSVFAGKTAPDPQNKWGIFGSRVSSGVTCP